MRLADILDQRNLRTVLESMAEPATVRPPDVKGSDAIKVHGYFVQGHWRRRVIPQLNKNGRVRSKRRYDET